MPQQKMCKEKRVECWYGIPQKELGNKPKIIITESNELMKSKTEGEKKKIFSSSQEETELKALCYLTPTLQRVL